MFKTISVLAILLILSGKASALDVCNVQSNSELSQCLVNEVKKAELDLSYTYRQALDAMYVDKDPATTKLKEERLRNAERAWVTYKDEQCFKFVGYMWEGGSGQGPAISVCELTLIRERIKTLKDSVIQ